MPVLYIVATNLVASVGLYCTPRILLDSVNVVIKVSCREELIE
jgi:hypothetical protein